MWGWLIGGYAIFILIVSGAATHVALHVADEARREMAYRVLKLVLGTGTGSGGLISIALKLHESGAL